LRRLCLSLNSPIALPFRNIFRCDAGEPLFEQRGPEILLHTSDYSAGGSGRVESTRPSEEGESFARCRALAAVDTGPRGRPSILGAPPGSSRDGDRRAAVVRSGESQSTHPYHHLLRPLLQQSYHAHYTHCVASWLAIFSRMDNVERCGIAIQLLPDWTPSSLDLLLARFDTLVKIPRGSVLDDGAIQLLLLDEQEHVLTLINSPLNLGGSLAGPSWKVSRGGLVKIRAMSTHASAVLNDVRSAPVPRLDATIPVLLQPITCQLGIAGEPHLWWRFYNRTELPIRVDRVFNASTLQLDDRTFSPRFGAYNGPAELPSKRALSGLWSLDEFDTRAREGRHRFRLSILDDASDPFVFEWPPPT
jgi:hypothetical protein